MCQIPLPEASEDLLQIKMYANITGFSCSMFNIFYLPFILCGSITTLASLDFLGLGLPPPSASLGEILSQGKNNLNAPWLGLSGFFTLSILLCLLVFIGEGLRDALRSENDNS